MTASPGGQLRIGDFIRFDGRLHEVIGMDGIVVILINDSGCRLAVKSAALLSDSTFEIVSSHRWRRPLPPAYFASLPAEFRDRALWLESHVSEVLDGVPAGSDPGTAPRPAYDVTRTTLRQRELAKWSELADAGHAIGVRTPGRVLTPNEMYAASLSVAGYVPVPLTAEDYIQLHPSQPRAINSYGIKLDHRVYDCEELNPYRGQPSGVKEFNDRWSVHYDPYDVTRVWVCNHHDGGWITAYWRQLHSCPQPFGDAAWQYARRVVAERGIASPSEDTIKAAVDDLLDRAAPPAAKPRRKTAKARRVAAHTAATVTTSVRPDRPAPPNTVCAGSGALAEPEESIAEVIPLPVFDPDKEAQSWW